MRRGVRDQALQGEARALSGLARGEGPRQRPTKQSRRNGQSRRNLGWLVGLLSLGWLLAEAQAAPPPDQIPSYQSQISQVELSVSAVDRDGRFVTDLRAEEIRIEEEGQPVPIENFELIHFEAPAADAAPLQPGQPEPLPPLRRRFFVFLDLLTSSAPGIRAFKPHLLQFARDTILPAGPSMVIALMPNRKLAILHDFNSPPDRLLAVLESIDGSAALSNQKLREISEIGETLRNRDLASRNSNGRFEALKRAADLVRVYAAEEYSRNVYSLQALGSFADWADRELDDPDERIVLFISESTTTRPGEDLIALMNSQIELSQRNFTRPNQLPVPFDFDLESMFRMTAGRLSRSRMTVYAVDPMGATGPKSNDAFAQVGTSENQNLILSSLRTLPALNQLAEPTGGLSFAGWHDMSKALELTDRDSRSRYLISYNAPAHKKGRKAKFYRISVRCTRPGVELRTRAGYMD